MKKFLIVFVSVLLSASLAFAQEAADSSAKKKNENWKLGGAASLNFSQVSFKNWAGGGEPSISGNLFFNQVLVLLGFGWFQDPVCRWLQVDYRLYKNFIVDVAGLLEHSSRYGLQANF